MKKLYWLVMFFAAISMISACTAAKNTGTAIGEGTKEVAEETHEAATDASITAAVKMKMADDELVSASDINVDTDNGIVTLNGSVQSPAAEQKAIDLARSVDGVKDVRSNLRVSNQ